MKLLLVAALLMSNFSSAENVIARYDWNNFSGHEKSKMIEASKGGK